MVRIRGRWQKGTHPCRDAQLHLRRQLDDEEFIERADTMLEDGRMILGYVRKSGEIEIHSPLFVPYPSALRRLKEVFGDVKVVGMGWTASTGEKRRPGGE